MLILAAALSVAPPASAHVARTVGPYTVEFGWGNEPALAGLENYVEVTVSDASGAPVADLGEATAEVSFGDSSTAVPLVATEEPGEFHATLMPTRPGTYGFRIDATVDGRQISTGATCSEGTFDCVIAAAEVQFPVKDPTAGELAERLDNSLPRAEQAADEAEDAKRIAIAALVAVVVLAAALAIVAGGRRKR